MKILESNACAVYIYDDEHPPPHVHLIFKGGTQIVIGIPMLEVWYGKSIDRKTRKWLENNLELLTDTWDSKHPQRN